MKMLTLKKDATYLGEKDEKYGWTVWAEVNEQDTPVMFNTQRAGLVAGTQIVAQESEAKTSKKGVAYLRLKKVSVGAVQAAPTANPSDELVRKLDAIYGEIKVVRQAILGIQKKLDSEKSEDTGNTGEPLPGAEDMPEDWLNEPVA